MTTRIQKRKAVADVASGDFEVFIAENSQPKNLVAGPTKSPKIQHEKLDEIKTLLRKELMSDLATFLAENQKEMLRLIAPSVKKHAILQNVNDYDSETENKLPASTSKPINQKRLLLKLPR